MASIDDAGAVTVEGEFVGRLTGFRFEPDPTAAGAEMKTLQAASVQALQSELARRIDKFYRSEDGEIDVTEQGGLMWGDSAVGRLEAKNDPGDPLAVSVVAYADEMIEPPLREKIERRLQFWIDRKLQAAFEPLFALRDDPEIVGLARGVAFQLLERYGVLPRQEAAEEIKALDQDARARLRKHGVRFGQYTVFLQALLKPAPTRFRLLLWGLSERLDEIPSPPPPGHVTIASRDDAPDRFWPMAGYRLAGPRAIRLDMMERLADLIRGQDARAGFEATPEMLSITGATLEQFAQMMEGLGFRAEKGERPKTAKPQAKPTTGKGKKAKAKPSDAAPAPAPTDPNATPPIEATDGPPSADPLPTDRPETRVAGPAETTAEAPADAASPEAASVARPEQEAEQSGAVAVAAEAAEPSADDATGDAPPDDATADDATAADAPAEAAETHGAEAEAHGA
ncbi:MAG: disulfide oxidoreductase, partial [Pseudomonadota bacterium]